MTDATGKTSSILNLVNKTLELPTLPEVLLKLNAIIADPDTSAEDVAKVITTDPAVATNILRIVNSAYYGLEVRVSSVTLAISIMGFAMTKKIALKAAVFSTFGKTDPREKRFLDMPLFWRHSILTGIAARQLGAMSPVFATTDGEDLYICGLLHDIGKIILLENHAATYVEALSRAQTTGREAIALEAEALGYNHADVGSVLAIKWFLPEDLAVAIRYHHAPARDPHHRALSSLIHLADRVAWNAGCPSLPGLPEPELDLEIYGTTGLDPEQVADAMPAIQAEFAGTEMPW